MSTSDAPETAKMAEVGHNLPRHNRAHEKNACGPLKLVAFKVLQKRILLARALRNYFADLTEVINDAGGATRIH